MKHSLPVTISLVILFLAAQIVGLIVTKQYIKGEELPLNIERPQVEESQSYLPIVVAIIVSTIIALILIKYKSVKIWKTWFFFSIVLCLTISFSAFINQIFAIIIAIILTYLKMFKTNVYTYNLSEIFIYGGLSGLFVPILGLSAVFILLILISLYDMIAVWKTKHMVKLAKFQSESNIFAGLYIPYSKNREAILGGGDIGFPLLFAGVILKKFDFTSAIIVSICATIALLALFMYAKKNKFYPAMPFLTVGCFIGYLVAVLLL
ncbi:hypothetical protein J4471_02390 [Candidatus Woesearchaeota archaeon]|nr:hypothetical protein [Candidatus Woesearchaeota archaeon]